jgi:hypothetical protein
MAEQTQTSSGGQPAEPNAKRESKGTANEATQKDTAAAASRLNTDNRAQSTNEATQGDTRSAQDRTQGGTGADKLNRRIATQAEQPQEQVLYTELQTGLTAPQLASFNAIICVNGVPWNAQINGSLTGEVT